MLTKNICSGFQLAEKYFVKGGDPRAAIEMYTKADMYEAAHKVFIIRWIVIVIVCNSFLFPPLKH